jgi:hypothetical protein
MFSSLSLVVFRRALLISTIVLTSSTSFSYIRIEIVIGSYSIGLLVKLGKALFLYSPLIRIPEALKVNYSLISSLVSRGLNFNSLGSKTPLAFLYTFIISDSLKILVF